MEKFLRLLSGYVRVTIEGEQLARFLNLCRGRGIPVRKVKYTGEEKLSAILSAEDFFKLGALRNKTGVHIHIEEKHGFPFFCFRNRKNKAFFVGSLLCLCILFLLSGHIWNIHIQGNITNSTPELLEFLEGQGISHGIRKSRVNCSRLSALVRREYPDITWVSAKVEGTRLLLTIREGEDRELPSGEKPACDLVSDVEGQIVRMVTRKGTPLVKVGDSCKKGDILVLGRVDVKNDSQEVVRYEYVHGDADIYVKHDLAYYKEFPMAYRAQEPMEAGKKSFYIRLGRWYLGDSLKRQKDCTMEIEEFPLRLTENFVLPIRLGKVTRTRHESKKAVYTEKQAKAIALGALHRYEEKLMQKGLQISENNVKIEIENTVCVSRGKLTVIEKTGREVPAASQEQPTERTAQDGEQHY